jgi:hypothetical protein
MAEFPMSVIKDQFFRMLLAGKRHDLCASQNTEFDDGANLLTNYIYM